NNKLIFYKLGWLGTIGISIGASSTVLLHATSQLSSPSKADLSKFNVTGTVYVLRLDTSILKSAVVSFSDNLTHVGIIIKLEHSGLRYIVYVLVAVTFLQSFVYKVISLSIVDFNTNLSHFVSIK
ncbi:hypothetical protein HOK00_08475, partial [bacterium]|nr:hypothetical protein [bacterium]